MTDQEKILALKTRLLLLALESTHFANTGRGETFLRAQIENSRELLERLK